jgi:hypothetical protein
MAKAYLLLEYDSGMLHLGIDSHHNKELLPHPGYNNRMVPGNGRNLQFGTDLRVAVNVAESIIDRPDGGLRQHGASLSL